MSLGSWAKKHLSVRFDSHTLGNLAKNASPAAALVGGPLGVALAGGLSAAGDLGRGKNIGQALRGGVQNAALGAGLQGGVGALKSAVHGAGAPALPGVASTASVPGAAPISAAPDLIHAAGAGLPSSTEDFLAQRAAGGAASAIPSVASALPGAVAPASGGGLLSGLAHAGGKALSFAEAHPNAASGALQGLGAITTSGSENRLRNAQANNLEQNAGETRYDFERRKQRDATLAPTWSALGTSFGTGGYSGAAKNPYLPAGA